MPTLLILNFTLWCCRGDWHYSVQMNFNRLVRYAVGKQMWSFQGLTEKDDFFVRAVKLTAAPTVSISNIKIRACLLGKLAVTQRPKNMKKSKARYLPENFQETLNQSKKVLSQI